MDQPTDLQKTFSNLVVTFGAYEFIFAFIDLFLNSFHVFILSRRHMRTSSMNSILLGIAIVDMVFPVIAIKKQVRTWIFGSGVCTAPEGFIETNVDWILYTIRDDFRRCSTWLGLSLAAVRTVSVRNTMNQKFSFVSRSRFGRQLVFSVISFSSLFSVFYYLRFGIQNNGTQWTPPQGCNQYEPGFSVPIYEFKEQELYTFSNGVFRKIYYIVVGTLAKFLPCFLFPLFTIMLIRELTKAKVARKAAKQDDKKDLTTRLVIYMTVSFFVIEFPIGICFFFEATANTFNSGSVATSIIQLLNMVYVVMTLTHFFICFFMSSQYRRTVKNTFSRGKQKTSASFVSVIQNARSETSAFH